MLSVLLSGLACCSPGFGCSVLQRPAANPLTSQSIQQLLDGNHDLRARAQLEAASEKPPDYDLLASRAELALGHFDAAFESAEKALAKDPKSATAHVQAGAVAGRMAEHASMFKQLSLAKRVRKELEEALLLDPKDADALYGSVLYFEIAPSFLGGDKAKAEAFAAQLTAVTPARGYLAEATLAHDRKDATAEAEFLHKAVAADPGSYDAHMALGVWAAKQEPALWEEADEQSCQALYLNPTRAEAWQLLVESAARDQCIPEIEGLLDVAQSFNPDDLSPAYHAAVAFIGTGKNLEYAAQLLKRYVESPPEGNAPSAAAARSQIALILEKQGHSDQALEMLRAAVNEDPTLDQARKDLKRLEHTSRTP